LRETAAALASRKSPTADVEGLSETVEKRVALTVTAQQKSARLAIILLRVRSVPPPIIKT
jgi:hypothetical protein